VYFKMIRYVLDTTLAKTCAARGISLADGQAKLRDHLLEMNEEWFSKVEPNIDYKDPFCRLAYLYAHTACNANICEIAIRSQGEVIALIHERASAGKEVRVCAFGGGPGTELLALVKYLLKTMGPTFPTVEINFTVLDRVVEWSESWEVMATSVRDAIKERWPNVADRRLHVFKSFMPFDMTKIEAFTNFDTILTHDLYVMNYVVSEVIDSVDALANVMGKMREAAPNDALFLIIDRDQPEVRERAEALVTSAGLQQVNLGTSCNSMDGDERASELDSYSPGIGRRPRLQWRTQNNRGVFWILAKKP
jgi:hypothetical protein